MFRYVLGNSLEQVNNYEWKEFGTHLSRQINAIDQDECVEHRKLHQLGGEAQFGFFILGGLSTIVIGPMADVYPRVRLLVTVIWTGALPCLLTLFIPNGVFGFYCFMTQRVLTGISVFAVLLLLARVQWTTWT